MMRLKAVVPISLMIMVRTGVPIDLVKASVAVSLDDEPTVSTNLAIMVKAVCLLALIMFIKAAIAINLKIDSKSNSTH